MITDYLRRRRARNAYWDMGRAAGDIVDQLYTVDDPGQRASLLYALGYKETALSDLHPIAWGADPNPGEDGRDVAESLGFSSILIRLLAATERQLRTGTDYGAVEVWLDTATDVEADAWRKLATVRDRNARANLILDGIYDHAVARYGSQAAEVLVTVAKTERELAAATLAGRAPAAPADPLLSLRRTVGAAFVLAGMFIALIVLLGPHH